MEDHATDRVTALLTDLARQGARAAIAELAPASAALRAHLKERLERPAGIDGSLLSDPVFEALFGWTLHEQTMSGLAGSLLHPQLVAAMDAPPADQDEHRFPADRHPYVHQVKCWRQLRQEPPRSVVVTSGTGSGKTECFLVPILDALVREAVEKPDPLTGVRALFLYPLNALINSQRDRLRAWSAAFAGAIRFCLYNGDTPEEVREAQQRRHPEEVLSRARLRDLPPPLLVTNATMLEYMLVRAVDAPILRASAGLLRWVVLDEAHTYLGSQAAEIALLLRRVLHAFGVRADDVRFIATSATIASRADPESAAALARFLADVAGVDPARVSVVTGQPDVPALPPPRAKAPPRIDTAALAAALPAERYAALAAGRAMQDLRGFVAGRPRRLSEIAARYWSKPPGALSADEREHTVRVLDLCTSAQDAGQTFLPLRVHVFHRTQGGVWVCVNPGCHGRSDPALTDASWGFGKAFLERRAACDVCGSLVLELRLCVQCGTEYAVACEAATDGGASRLVPDAPPVDADDVDEPDAEPDEVGDEGEPEEPWAAFRRLLAGGAWGGRPVRIDPGTGELDVPDGVLVHLVLPDETGRLRCARCRRGERVRADAYRPLRVGGPFFLGVAIPLLLQRTTAHADGRDRPLDGRRVVTFSDSRQGTARFAVQAQVSAERNFVRSYLYHLVASHRQSAGPDVGRCEGELRELEAIDPAQRGLALRRRVEELRRLIAQARAGRPGRISFADAVRALAKTPEVDVWMAAQWRHLPLGEFSVEDRSRFLILREVLRRPRRQSSVETLGLLRLDYPDLARLGEPDLPPICRQHGIAADEWQSFLRLCMDFVVRGYTCVDVRIGFLRWMGAPVRTRSLVGPEGERAARTVVWPSLPRNPQHRLTGIVARLLRVDAADRDDAEVVNATLADAWRAVRDLLTPFGPARQLDFDRRVELIEVDTGWLCPVTHRVLGTTVRGLTPYATTRLSDADAGCARVAMPRLPHPFWTQEGGREIPLAERWEWLETDPVVAAARRQGAWTQQSDRLAAFAPYFAAGEHSAQQSAARLRDLEARFKSGELNLLSCSTTMEMGVDIGGLTTVAMNNAPPGPANYRQRAGRAGRRGESVAVSFTLCKGDPHGEAVFANPTWPFDTPTCVPTVSLASEKIVRRHVNALCLTRFLALETGAELNRLTAAAFFDPAGAPASPCQRFVEWLTSASAPDDGWLARGLESVVRRTALAGVGLPRLLGECAAAIRGVAEQWAAEVAIVQQDLEAFGGTAAKPTPAQLALTRQLSRLREEYLLKELVSKLFLPGHGFPTDVVPFIPTTLEQLRLEERRRRRAAAAPTGADAEREDNLAQRRGYPARERPIAIREYAPGATVVLDGQVFESAGVTLNWHIPPGDAEVRELQAFRWAWRCRSCGATDTHPTRIDECPMCGAVGANVEQHEYLEPAGFAVDLRSEPSNDLTQRRFIAVEPPWITAGFAAWMPLPRPELGRYRYTGDGHVFHACSGPGRAGFAICLRCGRAAAEEGVEAELPDALREHTRLRGGREDDGSTRCTGNDEPFAIKRWQRLGTSARTDVFELQLVGTGRTDSKTAYSVAVALRQALAEHLGVDQREIGCAAVASRNAVGGSDHSIVLFDRAPGGAGFLAIVPAVLGSLLRRARAVLDCHRECDLACHACLLTFDTQYFVDQLDRHRALAVLSPDLLAGMDLPDELRLFGAGSQAEFAPLVTALVRELQRPDAREVRVYLGGPIDGWDPFEWSLRDQLMRFAADGRVVRLLVSQAGLAAMPPTVAHALATLAEAGRWEVRVTTGDAADAAVPNLVAEVAVGATCTRWASTSPAARVMGPSWGNPTAEDQVIRCCETRALGDAPGVVRAPEDVRPRPAPGLREIEVKDELNGAVTQFGERLWSLLEAECADLRDLLARPQQLASVEYRDRYVRSPMPARLLYEVVAALSKRPGGVGRQTDVLVSTSALPPNRTRAGERAMDDWISEEERRTTLKAAFAAATKFRLEVTAAPPHERELRLVWPDGAEWSAVLDQGFGFVEPAGSLRFPFTGSLDARATWLREEPITVIRRGPFATRIFARAARGVGARQGVR